MRLEMKEEDKIDRASRFNAYMVASTYSLELAQLDTDLRNKVITKEQYDRSLTRLRADYGLD